jgi:hypothetical protein
MFPDYLPQSGFVQQGVLQGTGEKHMERRQSHPAPASVMSHLWLSLLGWSLVILTFLVWPITPWANSPAQAPRPRPAAI